LGIERAEQSIRGVVSTSELSNEVFLAHEKWGTEWWTNLTEQYNAAGRDLTQTLYEIWGEHWEYRRNLTNMIAQGSHYDDGFLLWRVANESAPIILGKKQYELSNHLGNVLAVVSDKKLRDPKGNWTAQVLTAQDYYPFGMTMGGTNGRYYTAGEKYRYSFNGKEDDTESGIQDYGMRMYDKSLGRFLSVDPITGQYPFYTPYQFASNTPISAVDVDGLESDIQFNVNEMLGRPMENNPMLNACHNENIRSNINITQRIYQEPIGGGRKTPINHVVTTYSIPIPKTGQTVVHVRSDADIDYDGGKFSYTIDDQPINKIKPRDVIRNLAVSDREGFFPNGFVKSGTSFRDNQGKAIDAGTVSYIALPEEMYAKGNPWGIKLGDLAYIYNAKTGIGIYGIVADGSGKKMGEISDFANQKLKPGEGQIEYFIMTGTSTNQASELTNKRIQERGKAAFDPANNKRDQSIFESGEVRPIGWTKRVKKLSCKSVFNGLC
jgi:RHS repeat-associated protein